MIHFKFCQVARLAIAATLFSANASAAPATNDDDSAEIAEISGDSSALGIAEDELRLLTDAQIAAVTEAVNTGEIQQAHLALVRSRNPQVRAFALNMIVDHDAMSEQQNRLLARMGVAPMPNPVSARLAAIGEQQSAVLERHSGLAFDILYMHAQIQDHRTALELLDRQLIPSAREPALRALLFHARPMVVRHLALSQAILARLGAPR
jgi:putative membrane protein